MTATAYIKRLNLWCACGHHSHDHDDWPACESCDCTEWRQGPDLGDPLGRRLRGRRGRRARLARPAAITAEDVTPTLFPKEA